MTSSAKTSMLLAARNDQSLIVLEREGARRSSNPSIEERVSEQLEVSSLKEAAGIPHDTHSRREACGTFSVRAPASWNSLQKVQ